MRRQPPRELDGDASPAIVHKTVTPAYPDAELGHFRRGPYSIASGMKMILVLSLILFWLPTIGQMIAGYIGGRRAGGPWRGLIAAFVPVAILLLLVWGAERGFLGSWVGSLGAIPATIGQGVSAVAPPLAPYVQFVLGYLAAFVDALRGTFATGQNGYLVTIVFAYIGGVLADQARREAAAGRGTSVGISITQPLLHPFRRQHPEWGEDRADRFEDLRKIPVRAAAPRPKPQKVETRAAASGDQPHGPAEAAKTAPPRKELPGHDNEAATRRFVERALRQYEAAHRR